MSATLQSAWEMMILDAQNFVQLLHSLFGSEAIAGRANPHTSVPAEIRPSIELAAREIAKQAEALHLPVTANLTSYITSAATSQQLWQALVQVKHSMFAELENRKFYGPLQTYSNYFENKCLFGESVFNAFPSANNDIYEAGTCLALERGTACVMHLMRAQEIAVKAFAKALGIGPQNDWGSYVRLVRDDLANRLKVGAPRTPDEKFYAEANIQINSLRLAWRNPSMHPVDFYAPERAEEILGHIRSFMQHLATKISE